MTGVSGSFSWTVSWSGYVVSTTAVGAADDPDGSLDLGVRVLPNPSPGELRLRIDAPNTWIDEITIVDVSGRVVRHLAVPRTQGPVDITWNGRDDSGNSVAQGTYLAMVRAGSKIEGQQVSIVR
jgi:hypothetical protein